MVHAACLQPEFLGIKLTHILVTFVHFCFVSFFSFVCSLIKTRLWKMR